MGKFKCPECGEAYEGSRCPNCFAPAPETAPRGGASRMLVLVLVGIVVLIVAVVGILAANFSVVQEPAAEESAAVESIDGTQTEPVETTVETIAPPTVQEAEIYNSNGVVVTVKDAKNVYGDVNISVTVSNSSDRNVTVLSEYLSVNDYMLNMSGLYCDVAAGSSADSTLGLYAEELNMLGIDTIADVRFCLRLYNSDSYDDIDATDVITLDMDRPEGFVQSVDDGGQEIYSHDGVRVVFQGLRPDSYGDSAFAFYFENTTDRSVSVYTERVSANGNEANASLWVDLRPNTRAVDGMYFFDLEEVGVGSEEEIRELELTFRVVDTETWEDIHVSDPITLNPAQ